MTPIDSIDGGDFLSINIGSLSGDVSVDAPLPEDLLPKASRVMVKDKFDDFYLLLMKRPEDPNVERAEIIEMLEKIRKELYLGRNANAVKIERWTRFLELSAKDIYEAVLEILASPLEGVPEAVAAIGKKKES